MRTVVCHGFSERNPDGQSALRSASSRNLRIVRNILEKPYAEGSQYRAVVARDAVDEDNYNKLRENYLACLNTTAISAAGAQPLIDTLAVLQELWPIAPDDLETPLDVTDTGLSTVLLHLEKIGVESFLALDDRVIPDPQEPVRLTCFLARKLKTRFRVF